MLTSITDDSDVDVILNKIFDTVVVIFFLPECRSGCGQYTALSFQQQPD